MKKNIGKRILSLALALVMVAGWMPRMATEAHAAEPITLSDDTFTTSPGEGFAFRAYFYCNECKKEVYIDSNIENHKFEITSFTYKIANGTAQWNLTANYQGCRGSGTGTNTYSCSYNCTEKLYKFLMHSYGWNQSTKKYHGSIDVYLTRAKTTHQGDATCKTAANCTLCGTSYTNANNHEKPNEFTYSVNTSDSTKHDVKYACCGATKETVAHTAEPTYTVNVTDHTKHDKTYSCCEGIAETTGHSYTYTANDFVLTETCTNNCGHQAIASIVPREAIYTGSEITDAATISYDSGTWAGDAPVLSFENNVTVGTATAKMTAGGATASTTFKINPANISYTTVTFDPENGTYNGNAYAPDVTVTFNGATLVKDTDYTLSWDKNGFITPETYTVRVVGIGNFTGYVDKTFNINAADLDDVEVRQIGTLTYNGGDALTPTVSANAIAVNNQPITFTYCTEQNGIYGSLPSFTEAGTYTVYYKATAPNHNEATGSFTVTVDKKVVTEPRIDSKPYNGETQKADIPSSDLYTVTENNGGVNAGKYNVVLTLKDSENYKWSTADAAKVTLEFKIVAVENSWTVTPSINSWTYGETANAPVYEAKFGTVNVSYSGTANDSTTYDGTTPPTKAGNYFAEFSVSPTDNYYSISEKVAFTIEKADYDMSGARWDNSSFDYDGLEKTVTVIGLPSGVTVSGYEGNKATVVGNYTAKVTFTYDSNNFNAPVLADLAWSIKNDWTPTEYIVSTPNENGWLNDEFTIIPAEGYVISTTNTADGLWENKLTYSAETDNGSVTFYLKNMENGKISLGKPVTYKIDKTPATGKVEFVDRTGWEEFVNTITFGLFYKDEVTVKITTNDVLSGVASIEYYEANKAMTLDEVKALTNWTAYNGSFGVSVEDAKQFVYFVRITDNAGNVTYLSTDGAEYDTTAPAISGIENGKTYYTTQKVTVTEKNVESIKLNGETAGANITLDGNRDATYTIEVIDKAGNSTTVTVTMKPISDLSAPIDGLNKDNVNSSNEQTVDGVKAAVAAVDTTNATEQEKAALKEISDKADELEKVIDDTKAEIARINEELNKYNDSTVKSTDKDAIEQIIEDIDALLETENLTDAEEKALEDAKTKAEGLLDTIEDAAEATTSENTEKVKDVTAENVTPENKTDLEKAKEDLEKALKDNGGNYTDDEKKAIEDEIKRIDDALEVIENVEEAEELIGKLPENITKNDEDAIKAADDAYNALTDYEKSLVDADAKKALDEAKAALAELNKPTDTNSPQTGDNSNMMLWIALLFISGGAVITLTVVDRKRRTASKR